MIDIHYKCDKCGAECITSNPDNAKLGLCMMCRGIEEVE